MSGVQTNTPCADPVRLALYERLTSSFLKDAAFKPGTCGICGAKTDVVGKVSPACRAQSALTQKRDTAAEGQPIAFGSDPGGRPNFSMIDANCAILVEPGNAVFTGKVLPSSPLPEGASLRADLRFEDLLDQVMQDPKPPYFIGVFDKKARMRLEMSTSKATIVVNGKDPTIRLDRKRLLTLVSLLEEFGDAVLAKASLLRASTFRDPERALKLHDEIEASTPTLIGRLADVPVGTENELAFAKAVVRNRQRRAGDEHAVETKANDQPDDVAEAA